MDTFSRIYEDLVARKKRISEGLLNCIPSPFPRFREVYPGLEKAKYLLFSANSKIGKTQIADDMCLYEPLFTAIERKDLRIKWFYFTWEMSADQKYRQFLCHLLYRLYKVRIDVKQLRSVDAQKPLPDDALELLKSKEAQRYIKYFEENVTFVENIRHPTGINIFLEEYALKVGKKHFTQKDFYDTKGNVVETKKVFSHYEPNDPELYNIVIFDHLSLMTNERGLDKRGTIELFSKEFMVQLRNRYGFTLVAIQQQAASQESTENFKLDRLKPTADGLGDCKTTFQDVDLFFGLYSPYRYGIGNYQGYDIKLFKDNIRFLELVGGREGGGGNICPLYFDGAVNFFKELPRADNAKEMGKVYEQLTSIRQSSQPASLGAICLGLLNLRNYSSNGQSSRHFWILRRWKDK